MTTIPAPTAAPPLLVTLVHDYAQKALTTAAVALAAHGVIASSQEDQLIQLGVSAALFAFSCAWTYIAAKFRTQRLQAAIAAPAASPILNFPLAVVPPAQSYAAAVAAQAQQAAAINAFNSPSTT